jgi:mannitol 2-dehydrogenase
MKLRLLNGGHQAFAYLGLLAGHVYVHEAAGDPAIRAFVERYLDAEAAPTLGGVPADDVAAFRGALLGRFGNRAVADTLVRLATDASDRIPQFILPVIRERLAAGGDVTRSAAIVASWARWCAEAAAEHGATAIPDDRRDSLAARARRSHDDPDAFVSDREVFGDLAEDERFRGPYRAALSTLDGDGVTAALASLA